MNTVERLEDTLNGGYGGLYGEVVTCDIYRLKQLKFKPDLIYDIGANVGIFTRFVRSLFPDSRVVAVEPDPENCAHFRKFTPDVNVCLVQAALGTGLVYHAQGAANGAHQSYLSACMGYPKEYLEGASRYVAKPDIEFVRLDALVDTYSKMYPERKRILMKIDCEGAENGIWSHGPSMDALRAADCIVMELHNYAMTHEGKQEVIKHTDAALKSLEATHVCERQGVNFWATKR